MALTPERIDRLKQRRARLVAHIDDPNSTPLAERRLEWQHELAVIDAELAGIVSASRLAVDSGVKVDVPVGQMTAKTP